MIVYHGTTMVLEKPDVAFSKDYLDFGKGFYVTQKAYEVKVENDRSK
ncbi:MAG: DUF3990 domain-containing protein [Roseburia sp.]|nr:DUF3990 domain-containing protein [Roseburia sp.]